MFRNTGVREVQQCFFFGSCMYNMFWRDDYFETIFKNNLHSDFSLHGAQAIYRIHPDRNKIPRRKMYTQTYDITHDTIETLFHFKEYAF